MFEPVSRLDNLDKEVIVLRARVLELEKLVSGYVPSGRFAILGSEETPNILARVLAIQEHLGIDVVKNENFKRWTTTKKDAPA